MAPFTPTPDAAVFLAAAVVSATAGATALAEHLRTRLAPGRPEAFYALYALVLWTTAAAALATMELELLPSDPVRVGAGAAAGIAVAAAAVACDSYAYRLRSRVRLRNLARASGPRDAARGASAVQPPSPLGGGRLPGPLGLTAIAVGEEILFRGALVDLSLALPGPLAAACLAGGVAVFALVHAQGGWIEVLAKAPLGALALAGVLATGTVVAPVTGHVLFNLWMWRARRKAGAR